MPTLPSVWNVEWYNTNSQRRYPLRDDASLRDVTDSFSIPNDLIVEFAWPAHAFSTIDPTGFYVSSISVFGSGVVIQFSYLGEVIGSVNIDSETFIPNLSKSIRGIGTFADTVGTVVIGSLSGLDSAAGTFTFESPAKSGFLPSAVKLIPRGVSAIYIKNGDDLSDALQGDLTLESGRNFLIEYQRRSGTPTDPNVISLSAISGAGLNLDCGCDESTPRPCIKTIDGVPPNSEGDFHLDGDECVKLDAIANGLQIKDTCSKPCCGCQELDVVKTTLQSMSAQVTALNSYADKLSAQILNMEINMSI